MKKIVLLFIFLIQLSILEAGQGSVVCLHGFLRSYKCMIPLGNTLKREGLNVYLWDYQSRKATIDQHASNLVEVLNAIAHKHPGEPIHFCTHSFGGIIVRAAVNHPNCPEEAKIGKAILMAPPNKGAVLGRAFKDWGPVSWFFGKKAGKQLITYSEEDMNAIGSFPETMDVMVIAGKRGTRFFRLVHRAPNDGKVTVDETRLPTPHEHKILDVSHNWIMTSRESIAITKDFLLPTEERYAARDK